MNDKIQIKLDKNANGNYDLKLVREDKTVQYMDDLTAAEVVKLHKALTLIVGFLPKS